MVTIKPDHQQGETDEEVLHKHHEQFHRLVTLLLTDIGDRSLSSLRQTVLDWEEDSNRSILAVNSGHVQWVLEKSSGETSDICNLCASSGSKCGFVRDARLEVIAEAEADVIAQYLELAIQLANQRPAMSNDEAKTLEEIRDAPAKGPAAPLSIRDDVSISVRNDRPKLEHEVAKIRKRDAETKITKQEGGQPLKIGDSSQAPKPIRRRTADNDEKLLQGHFQEHRVSNVSEATVKAVMDDLKLTRVPTGRISPTKAPRNGTKTPGKKPAKLSGSIDPVSILFLSSSHLRKCR